MFKFNISFNQITQEKMQLENCVLNFRTNIDEREEFVVIKNFIFRSDVQNSRSCFYSAHLKKSILESKKKNGIRKKN